MGQGEEDRAGLDLFRTMVGRLAADRFAPDHAAWEKAGTLPRAVWREAGENGLLCCDLAEDLGGPGGDFRHSAALIEVLAAAGLSGPCYSFMVHSDIVAPYIRALGTPAQKAQWLPRMASGAAIGAIAMTEPGTGTDLQAVSTTARRQPDGSYRLNGSKTFITNGGVADLIVVVAKTSPEKGGKGISLFAVDAAAVGVRRGRSLEKLGMKACNTAELFFDDLEVPADALLGEEDRGFGYLMSQLPRERLMIAVAALAAAEATLAATVAYTRERKVFGRPVAAFQNTAFRLAELHAELCVARAFVDQCIARQRAAELDSTTASIAKLTMTELQGRVVDACVQFHGGYGYMWEQPVTRAFADARVMRIFGGTNEIMKDLISRALFR